MDTARILKEIDRFEWKHSWHLKKAYGTIDWSDPENVAKIRKVLREHRDYAREMNANCELLLDTLP